MVILRLYFYDTVVMKEFFNMLVYCYDVFINTVIIVLYWYIFLYCYIVIIMYGYNIFINLY